ncbi:hypothetical protein OC844_006279 [Tilletia horrida]|nr:hypothetical protein OC844_006279 [Tilletia horrida]
MSGLPSVLRPVRTLAVPVPTRCIFGRTREAASPAPPSRQGFSTSSTHWNQDKTQGKEKEKGKASLLRSYFYHVDVHGQLFLTETEPKNITSCFKSAPFLDFFFQRLGPNPALDRSSASSTPPKKQTPVALARAELENDALQEGYPWLSPCGPEMNFVKAEATPVVFRELDEEGFLHWGGSLKVPFDPAQMVVDIETGYLYHPSPRSSDAETTSRYGPYSLLSSALVLTHFSSTLEYGDPSSAAAAASSEQPDPPQTPQRSDPCPGQSTGTGLGATDGAVAGTVEWRGRRWALGVKPGVMTEMQVHT